MNLLWIARLGLPICWAVNLLAAQHSARWIGQTDGAWSNPANWDIGQVPNNTLSDTYDVIWDAPRVQVMLEQSQALKVIYEKRLALQQIWVKTSANVC